MKTRRCAVQSFGGDHGWWVVGWGLKGMENTALEGKKKKQTKSNPSHLPAERSADMIAVILRSGQETPVNYLE